MRWYNCLQQADSVSISSDSLLVHSLSHTWLGVRWCACHVQFFKLSRLVQGQQEKFDLMPEKVSQVTRALEEVFAEVNQTEQEWQDQVTQHNKNC